MINRAMLTITSYWCPRCERMHKVDSQKGISHRILAQLPPNCQWPTAPQPVGPSAPGEPGG